MYPPTRTNSATGAFDFLDGSSNITGIVLAMIILVTFVLCCCCSIIIYYFYLKTQDLKQDENGMHNIDLQTKRSIELASKSSRNASVSNFSLFSPRMPKHDSFNNFFSGNNSPIMDPSKDKEHVMEQNLCIIP